METEEVARLVKPLPPRPQRRRWAIAAGIAAVVIAVVGAGVVLGWFDSDPEPDVASPSPTTTAAETPTTAAETPTTAGETPATAAETPTTAAATVTTVPPSTEVSSWPDLGGNAPMESATVVGDGADSFAYVAATETWIFDQATLSWTRRSDAPQMLHRFWSSGAFDPGAGRMVLFGGETSYWGDGRPFDDLWSYDLDTDSWELADVADDRPEARRNPVLLYVDSIDGLLLFGGFGATSGLSDTWLFDGDTSTWTQVPGEGPPGKDRPLGVYDPVTDRVFVYGGSGFESGSMWTFDPSNLSWSSRPMPDGWGSCYGRLWRGFDPRCGLPAVYDESRQLVLSVEGDDLLTWDPTTDVVERRATTGADLEVRDHHLVLDPARDSLFLLQGGDDERGGQLWRLDLATLAWQLIGPTEGE